MVARKSNGPIVGHIFFLAVFGMKHMHMMAKFMVKDLPKRQVLKRPNPSKRSGRHFNLINENLNPGLLPLPFLVVKSRNFFPSYAPASSR